MSIVDQIPRLPLQFFFKNLPAFPVDLEGMLDTLAKLAIRGEQVMQAKQGLTEMFTINGRTDVAYQFLFGTTTATPVTDARAALMQLLRDNPAGALAAFEKLLHEGGDAFRTPSVATANAVSLDDPKQFSISWTTFPAVYQSGLQLLPAWAASLTDIDSATAQFWPMIAQNGVAYNLLIAEKVSLSKIDALRSKFESVWSGHFDSAAAAGNLYVIDMSRFEALKPQFDGGAFRGHPADARPRHEGSDPPSSSWYQGISGKVSSFSRGRPRPTVPGCMHCKRPKPLSPSSASGSGTSITGIL
jgi:hypothetical protein